MGAIATSNKISILNLVTSSDGLHPNSDGLHPDSFLLLLVAGFLNRSFGDSHFNQGPVVCFFHSSFDPTSKIAIESHHRVKSKALGAWCSSAPALGATS